MNFFVCDAGEPNHQSIGQNNDHFDMGLLNDIILDSDMEGVTGCTFHPISTYFGNMEGVTDIGAFLSSSPNDLANENAGVEIPMGMLGYPRSLVGNL